MTDYNEQQTTLDEQFLAQLDKTMDEYPPYNIGQNDAYPSDLSILNGITQQLTTLQTTINQANVNLERNIQYKSSEIEKYKTIEQNLKNVTSIDDLDATSKQMLADSVSEYRQYTIVFWIKFLFILVIVADLVRYKRMDRAIIILGLSLAMTIVYVVYKYLKK